jgi:glycosyltransferase involved in cell wall biosynthesis
MIKISVVITTKNEEHVIENLLKSIFEQTYRDYEIILIDNNSSDNTASIAKKYGVKVYSKGPERSVQRNYGVEKATGDYVLILDADMVLTKNVLRELSGINNQMAVVPEKSYGEGFFVKYKIFEREFYEGEEFIEAPRFFSKKLFLKYGGYDKDITGPEDYDLPLRMKKDGYKSGRIKSYILHNEKKFNPLTSAKKKFYYASKAGLYVKRHKEMIFVQGNLIFRPVYFKKWRKIINNPLLSFGMILIKILEGSAAVLGYIYGKFKK